MGMDRCSRTGREARKGTRKEVGGAGKGQKSGREGRMEDTSSGRAGERRRTHLLLGLSFLLKLSWGTEALARASKFTHLLSRDQPAEIET